MRYGNSTSSYILPLSTKESNFGVTGHLSDTDNGHLSDNMYEILRTFVRQVVIHTLSTSSTGGKSQGSHLGEAITGEFSILYSSIKSHCRRYLNKRAHFQYEESLRFLSKTNLQQSRIGFSVFFFLPETKMRLVAMMNIKKRSR